MAQLDIDWGEVPDDVVQGFIDFHEANPDVYDRLEAMTAKLAARGRKRVGIAMLFEVLRWQHYMQTEGEPFKLNNNYRAFYSRLIEANNPQWAGLFTKRGSISDTAVVRGM